MEVEYGEIVATCNERFPVAWRIGMLLVYVGR